MAERSDFEAIIIGCGIAGASLAYFLAKRGVRDILILEREEQPGYHATGRSAAVLVEFDWVPSVLALKIAGAEFLRKPPKGFSENPLLETSGVLVLFQGPFWEQAQQMLPSLQGAGVVADSLSPREALSQVPVLKPQNFDGALFFPEDGHIDVHGLLWSYLRHAKREGAQLHLGEEVVGLKLQQGRCAGLITRASEYASRWVVNAAGAWAAMIRNMAGPSPVRLTPYRRTIITFAAPEGLEVGEWPLTADLSHELYFGPESGGLLASPMDQEPMEPCDARADDWAVAQAVHRLEQLAPELVPKSILRKWAGLRTFAPDEGMVIGEDPMVRGFFWLCGQGGAGIETSGAVGQIASDLMLEGRTELMDVTPLSPSRFAEIQQE